MMWRIRGDGAALLIKWSKAGLLVIPLMLVGLAIGSVGQELFNGTPLVTDTGWVAGFAVSAVLIRVIGRRLNACGDLHTLYDMPMQHWWWLGVACSALTLGIVILIRSVWSPRPGLAAPRSTTRPQ